MNTKTNQKNSPGRAFTSLILIPLLLAMPLGAQAADQYFACDGTALSTSKWGTSAAGPFLTAWTPNNTAVFAIASGTGTGGSITVGGINATENFTISTAGGTIGGVAGAINPITVSAGKLFDAGSQAWTSGATVGFSMNGEGVFASAGGTYGGGFVLNSGTVIARGANTFGANATPGPLTINGGAIGANASRNFLTKYSSINIGGNFQLGVLNSALSLSSDTAFLNFGSPVNLGAAARTITIGGNASYIFSGIISGSPGVGLIVTNLPGATGNLTLSNANTFDGGLTIKAGIVIGALSVASLGSGTGAVTLGDSSGSADARLILGAGMWTNPITVAAGSSGLLSFGMFGNQTPTNSGNILLNNTLIVTNGNAPAQLTLSGVISGPGALVCDGLGAVNLAGANTFSGGVTLNGFGYLSLNNGGTGGTSSALGTGTLTINGGTLANGSGSDVTISTPNLQIWNGDFTNTLVNSITFGTGAVTLGGNRIVTATSGILTVPGAIGDGGNNYSLTKAGAGQLTLSGTNTYTGDTTVADGTLRVNGSLASGAVQVNAGTLDGNGIINGPVTVASGATLAPGIGATGRLTINNTLVFAAGSINLMEIDKANGTNDTVNGLAAITYGGTLTVNNLGGTFAGGESYQLFSATTYNPGNFAATNLPALNPGLKWVWTPASGTLAVAMDYATTPTNLVFNVSGTNLSLTWPGSHLGWYAQSNSVDIADTNYWINIPGSTTVTNLDITIDPAQPNVFYRLKMP